MAAAIVVTDLAEGAPAALDIGSEGGQVIVIVVPRDQIVGEAIARMAMTPQQAVALSLTLQRYAAEAMREMGADRPYPHGVSCRCCLQLERCNQCGAQGTTTANGMCTNGRCRSCCAVDCHHPRSM